MGKCVRRRRLTNEHKTNHNYINHQLDTYSDSFDVGRFIFIVRGSFVHWIQESLSEHRVLLSRCVLPRGSAGKVADVSARSAVLCRN